MTIPGSFNPLTGEAQIQDQASSAMPTMTPISSSGPGPGSIPAPAPSLFPRKANRACNHCHRSHLTCDLNRPCLRCVQRGLDHSCMDAPRKRKKYLENTTSAIAPSTSTESVQSEPQPPQIAHPQPYLGSVFSNQLNSMDFDFSTMTNPNCMDIRSNSVDLTNFPIPLNVDAIPDDTFNPVSTHPFYDFPPDQGHIDPPYNELASFQPPPAAPHPKKQVGFMLAMANQEYSTLGHILMEDFDPRVPMRLNDHTPISRLILPALSPTAYSHHLGESTSIDALSAIGSPPVNLPANMSRVQSLELICDDSINQYSLGPTGPGQMLFFPDVIGLIKDLEKTDPLAIAERYSRSHVSFAIGSLRHRRDYKLLGADRDTPGIFTEPEEIYAKVNKPFVYTTGYHLLISNLRQRFSKPMLVRMAQLMAEYRPSFIACTKSLKEGDLIFMEQCFQRSLLTFDQYIRLSGTPTIVWRRTGEIAYVGDEFCILTGWLKKDLVGLQRKFIVDLLDDDLVVEYFENFSRIAFHDFEETHNNTCTLLTPNPEVKVRTGCSWTINRDVFGIPMMIIGSFLPIL